MFKKFIEYTISFGVLFFLGLYIQSYYVEKQSITLFFSLVKVYLFHFIFSLLVCGVFFILSSKEKLFQQLGFIYLGVLMLKIILFCGVFYNPIFTIEKLPKIDSISLLIPIALFLILEVFFIAKILNKK